jgi:hypothetical protein
MSDANLPVTVTLSVRDWSALHAVIKACLDIQQIAAGSGLDSALRLTERVPSIERSLEAIDAAIMNSVIEDVIALIQKEAGGQ